MDAIHRAINEAELHEAVLLSRLFIAFGYIDSAQQESFALITGVANPARATKTNKSNLLVVIHTQQCLKNTESHVY